MEYSQYIQGYIYGFSGRCHRVSSFRAAKITIDAHGRIKCYLKSAPEKGRANQELVKFISTLLTCPQDDVEIVSGEISRKKRLKIHRAITYDQFKELLGLEDQKKIF